jgi:hypothetical protein
MNNISRARKRPQPAPRIYCPIAFVANPDGTVDYEDLPHVVYCMLEEITAAFQQVTGVPPKRKPKVGLTMSIEF